MEDIGTERTCSSHGAKRTIDPKDHLYLVTIKPHEIAYHSKEVLDGYLARTVKRLTGCKADWSSIIGYEEDSEGRMHLHTTVQTCKIPLFKRINNDKKVQIHFQHCDSPADKVRAQSYCVKHGGSKYSIAQRFDANYIRHAGGFELLDILTNDSEEDDKAFMAKMREFQTFTVNY